MRYSSVQHGIKFIIHSLLSLFFMHLHSYIPFIKLLTIPNHTHNPSHHFSPVFIARNLF